MKPILALLGAASLQAVTTAVLGVSFTISESVVMLIIGAALATVIGQCWLRRQPSHVPSPVARRQHRPALLRLNIASAICFGAFFLGIVVHEAPVVFALEVGTAPLAATVWSWQQSRRTAVSSPRTWQWAGSGAMAILSLAMAAASQADDPAQTSELLVGCLLGITAGIAVAAIAVTSRSLGAAGFTFPYVLANRFHATYLGAGVVLPVLFSQGRLTLSASTVLVITVMALTAMVLPLVLLQFAMMRTSPVTVTAALAAVPAGTALTTPLAGGSVGLPVAGLALLIVPISIGMGRLSVTSPTTTLPSPSTPSASQARLSERARS